MKKILFLITLLLILGGCKNKEIEIKTIISNDNNSLVSITYPITNIKKLDKSINNYINNKRNNITDELNIDYTLNIVSNRYINVTLETYESINNTQSHDIATYIFDKKKNKFLKLNNLISENSLYTINQIITKKTSLETKNSYDLVTFDENNLCVYYNNKNKITKVDIPTHDLEILLDITLDNKMKKEYKSYNTKRIIDSSKPVVVLSKYTDNIIDILNENDANATFFVLGNKVKYYSNTLKKMLSYGNEIGNHTYRVINKTKDESIVLLHDTKKRTIEALKIIIKDLKEKEQV